MDVTLLGSGDALGMPVPLCDCSYCERGPRRRRPSVLVETGRTTLLLDASPDCVDQLAATNTTTLDAVCCTHHHFDHVGGLKELNHAAMDLADHVLNLEDPLAPAGAAVELYLTRTAATHLRYRASGVHDRLDPTHLAHGESVAVGDCRLCPFPVEHARPAFDTVGFAVTGPDGGRLVYAPDLRRFAPDRPAGEAFENPDLLVAEGGSLFRGEPHGPEDELRDSLARAGADRTVLVNLSEHLHQQSTDELRDTARAAGYELGADFETYTV